MQVFSQGLGGETGLDTLGIYYIGCRLNKHKETKVFENLGIVYISKLMLTAGAECVSEPMEI